MEEKIFFDLTLNEIAIILHSFLKKSETQYATINFHIEKYFKTLDEDRYTLIIIACSYRIPKNELLVIYKKICDANNLHYFKGDDI
jgi:hypothetical protein